MTVDVVRNVPTSPLLRSALRTAVGSRPLLARTSPVLLAGHIYTGGASLCEPKIGSDGNEFVTLLD